MREKALKWLYRELKSAKIALGRAEGRPGDNLLEIGNLNAKIDAIDWLIPLAIKAEDGAIKHNPSECRYYTGYSFGQVGGCCVGTMKIDTCKGEDCDRWMPKEGRNDENADIRND